MKTWHICAYYTPEYENVYHDYLFESIHKMASIQFYVEQVNSFGNWKMNTDIKPKFASKMLQMFDKDIVLVDVDATINTYPELFDNIPQNVDVAYHMLDWETHYGRASDKGKKEFLSGTLFLRNNEKVKTMVKDWMINCQSCRWEQLALEKALKQNSELVVYELPREYCYIESTPPTVNGGRPAVSCINPVIIHHQHSRKLNKKDLTRKKN